MNKHWLMQVEFFPKSVCKLRPSLIVKGGIEDVFNARSKLIKKYVPTLPCSAPFLLKEITEEHYNNLKPLFQ